MWNFMALGVYQFGVSGLFLYSVPERTRSRRYEHQYDIKSGLISR